MDEPCGLPDNDGELQGHRIKRLSEALQEATLYFAFFFLRYCTKK